MWNALEGGGVGVGVGVSNAAAVSSASAAVAAMDPASLLMNTQLASALSLTGDAQYWEESISPSTIRQELSSADPSNASSTPTILRGMKWLLAGISKGRNVSDFYPHVVKLVGAVSLEVRKMVYMYLVQYANHNSETRELSLLSINAFQRGMADAEQWIRALALRVLTSIAIPDILQIQIMGVQKCAQDKSPYVRKCAANALSKLCARCDAGDEQRELLLRICQELLLHDQATMVLTSALIAWQELCPQRLDMLHGCFRKFCHLLTDMDEWGQVVVLEVFSRYCRKYFAEPPGWRDGSAERIDRERRVRRTIYGVETETAASSDPTITTTNLASSLTTAADQAAAAGVTLPPRNADIPNKVKRRVVKTAFYSDEEEESTDEEVYAESVSGPALPLASLMRQRNILGIQNGTGTNNNPFLPRALQHQPSSQQQQQQQQQQNDPEEADLAEDHRLFLNAAMHLLKSRNAGVVLAVCSLQYYCGVSSIKVRAAMGKALIRIHRDLREVQYVVLASIRTLASECPSAFTPFLQDFFVKASLDPPFTRIIKLDILASLALEPAAIDAVLQEMRSYVRHGDTQFARAAIRAVGRVVELARIVYDRHGHKNKTIQQERSEANKIALNSLYGLLTLTQVPQNNRSVVGEAVNVMRLILQLLQEGTDKYPVSDPNHVQLRSIQRILLLLMKTLAVRATEAETKEANNEDKDERDDDDDHDEEGGKKGNGALDLAVAMDLPGEASATATWIIGEQLAEFALTPAIKPFDDNVRSRIRLELLRMFVKAFTELSLAEKEQGIHLASKLIVSGKAGGTLQTLPGEGPLCEQLLAMGRVDVNPDVRDRARFESMLLRSVSLLEHDLDAMEENTNNPNGSTLTLDHVKRILSSKRPPCSSLPVENHSNTHALDSDGFRFGSLSSLVGHQARNAYIQLPPWAEEDSPSSLRNPPTTKKPTMTPQQSQPPQSQPNMPFHGYSDGQPRTGSKPAGSFYDKSESSSSSDGSSTSSSSSDDDSSSSSSSSDDDDDSSSSDDSSRVAPTKPVKTQATAAVHHNNMPTTAKPAKVQTVDGSDDDDSSDHDDDDDSSDDSSDDDGPAKQPAASSNNLIPMMNSSPATNTVPPKNGSGISSSEDDLRGLVIEPIVTEANQADKNPDTERDSSGWFQLVRPEHAGGLSVLARYLRGPTKAREAKLLGLKPESSTLVFLQLLLESQPNASTTVFRRIKWLPRQSTGSSIGPKKIYFPPEIDQLKAGQRTECIMGLDFTSPSDRDGTLLAKFDFKFGTGGIPVEIKPTLGDVLLPCARSANDFETEMKPLQGFQRVETQLVGGNVANESKLQNAILKAAALTTCAGKHAEHAMRFVGTLPDSGDIVYVKVTQASGVGGGAYKAIVCSDNALAANSLMNVVKKKIQASL